MKNPRHILITGASSGIGAALALAYAAPNIRLSLHGRNVGRLETIALQAHKNGAIVTTHARDVSDAAGMAAWISECDKHNSIDLVIANAGISGGTSGQRTRGESAEQTAQIFAINVNGVFNTVLPALEKMKTRRQGQIAIVSSVAGFRGFAGATAYCASKAAVRVWGEGLRAEMATQKIEVNVICPGFIKTPMTDVNPFPMPFMMSAERAALIIMCGLAANKGRIAFPWQTYALARIVAALPQFMMDYVATKLPRK